MQSSQNIEVLKQFEAFKGLDDNEINILSEKISVQNFSIGQIIATKSIIQDPILLILQGETRLLGLENQEEFTIAKLGTGNFIGLASFLRVNPCEQMICSTQVKAMAIPAQIILNLYQNKTSFYQWCCNKIFLAELNELIEIYLKGNEIQKNIRIKILRSLIKNANVLSHNDIKNQVDNLKDKFVISASKNIKNKQIGSIIEINENLDIIPPLDGRLYVLNQSEMNLLKPKKNQKLLNNSQNPEDSKEISLDGIKEESGPRAPSSTNLNLGQYEKKKSFKLISGEGHLYESLANIEMLTNELNIPFRKDSIEKFLRDAIREDKAPSMELLGGILSTMGLHSSGAKIPTDLGTRLQVPSLIKWKDGFALCRKSNIEGISIASPREGLIEIKKDNLTNEFPNGIELIMVEKNEYTPEKNFGVEWFWPVLNKYKGVLIQVLAASFVVQLFGLANPLLIQVIIDKVINQRSLETLQVLGFALIVVTILGGVLSSLRTYLFTETTNRIDMRLGAEVIDRLLRLPLNYFDKRPVGELGSRIAELEKIRNFLTGQALTSILDAGFSIIYIIVMVLYSWLLTFIALGVVPIQVILTLIGTPLIRRQIRETAKQNAKTQSHLVEVLTGVQTVKAQNVETVSRWKWQELYSQYISRTFEKTITGTTLNQISQVLQQLSQLLVLWIGAGLVLNGKLTLGQLIAFRIISGYVTQPLLRLSTIWQNIQELRVSFERLADIVDTPEESNEADKANIPLPQIKGNVVFDNVSFAFKRTSPNVLNNINLEIKEGTFVGVVGQSGSGKSTLMKLVPRLYLPQKGSIKIDRYDITKVELYSLRRQVGIVPQEPLLFAGTVAENIAITDQEASSDEVVKAARIAEAHDFIMDLPMGYSTPVGERGAGLSGGQRQRIAIARTVLSKPKLLILDEATSALDYSTESRVCENLINECKGQTVFFITHRLSTIKNADEIVMLHKGSIDEIGTHSELLEKKGRYYALYRQQESL